MAGRAFMKPFLPCAQNLRLFFIFTIALHACIATIQTAEQCNISVSVTDIHYSGFDKYLVTVSAVNDSSKALLINGIDCRFTLQKENGWETLLTGTPDSMRPLLPLTLAAGGRSDFAMSLKIPLTLPGLFRTYEGDVSLMLTYRILCIERLAGQESQKTEESLYWISPRTSTWVHREGM